MGHLRCQNNSFMWFVQELFMAFQNDSKSQKDFVWVMGKWAQYEKVTIKRVFSLVNVIILTLIRSNLLVFKQKTRTGQKIIACK